MFVVHADQLHSSKELMHDIEINTSKRILKYEKRMPSYMDKSSSSRKRRQHSSTKEDAASEEIVKLTSTKKKTSTTTTTTASTKSITSNDTVLRFYDGAVQFRLRIIISLLSCRTILIKNIRCDNINNTGLSNYEISFLRLIDNITNGTTIEINSTGTQLRFVPGIIIGGTVQHNCPVHTASSSDIDIKNNVDSDTNNNEYKFRSISWFLEGILPIAPYGKEPIRITFTGITDGMCHIDPSCDYWKRSIIPIMTNQYLLGNGTDAGSTKDFMGPEAPSITIQRRGAAPHGGGLVVFFCPIIQSNSMLGGCVLPSIDFIETGLIKRIRGTAISTKIVSSSTTARIAYSTKGLLHRLLPDVWIHTDVHTIKNHNCGIDPSVSLVLSAQSTTGVILTTECCLQTSSSSSVGDSTNTTNNKELPEDMGIRGGSMILDEIKKGGCIDSTCQSIVLLWMCLSTEDVSRIRLGTISSYTIQSLRLYQQVFGITFKIVPDNTSKTIIVSCLGSGYRNMARAST